jgi:hypothetical protein
LGDLIFTQGTAAAPKLQLSGDSNTGVYSPGADAIAFTTGGTEKLLAQSTDSGAEVVLSGTSALQLHSGTTTQRPSSPVNGMIRYNSDDDVFEGYEDGEWVRFSNANEFADNVFRIFDNVDNTKLLAFEVAGLTTATTRTVTMVNRNITLDTVTVGSTDTNALAGSILFSTGTKVEEDNANLFWDNANNRLGVGTNTPTTTLEVAGTISTTGTSPGQVRWYEDPVNGTNYVAFQAAANIAANVTWTLPAADGSNGFVLSTNGSGVLSWSNPNNLVIAYNAITDGTNTENAGNGAETVTFTGGEGVDATVGATNTVTFDLDFNGLTSEPAINAATDELAFYDVSASAHRKITPNQLVSALSLPRVFRQAFVNGDLTAGVITFTHNLNNAVVMVQVFDNNGQLIIPDTIDNTGVNTTEVDLTSFGTLAGTWNVIIVG